MALKIRLTRVGAIHNPHYRVVVAEARSRRDGAPAEFLGTYAPRNPSNQIKLDLPRIDYWISKGAKPTDTLNAMIKKARKLATEAPATKAPATEAPAAEAPATEAPAAKTPAAEAPATEAPAS